MGHPRPTRIPTFRNGLGFVWFVGLFLTSAAFAVGIYIAVAIAIVADIDACALGGIDMRSSRCLFIYYVIPFFSGAREHAEVC